MSALWSFSKEAGLLKRQTSLFLSTFSFSSSPPSLSLSSSISSLSETSGGLWTFFLCSVAFAKKKKQSKNLKNKKKKYGLKPLWSPPFFLLLPLRLCKNLFFTVSFLCCFSLLCSLKRKPLYLALLSETKDSLTSSRSTEPCFFSSSLPLRNSGNCSF